MRIILIVLVLFFSLPGASQSYDDFKEDQKKVLIKEDFTRALPNFKVEGKEDDYYHKQNIMYGHDITLKTTIARSFSSIGNLEYELFVRQSPEIDYTLSCYTAYAHEENPSRLDFVCKDDEFMLIGRGEKKNQDRYLLKAGDEFNSFVRPDSFNKITIRRIDTLYYLFVNEHYVGSMEYDYKRGQEFSISTEKHQIELDYFTLSKLLDEPIEKEVPKELALSRTIESSPVEMEDESFSKKYHALIIGNNNYVDPNLADLDQPISDATKLVDVLTRRYLFEKEQVVFLKDATRKDIIRAMDEYSSSLTNEDNLLIFYAGHGHWDEKKGQGYWLPVDAEKDITADWLRNSTIQGYIESTEAKHTLLIADACFGGGIFKTRAAFSDASKSINNLYKYDSRKAMTSGMLNEVPDKSVFMESLVERLENNEEKYLPSMNLFMQFREVVMNNSYNAPQYGTIHNAGDKGGDFIFILREQD